MEAIYGLQAITPADLEQELVMERLRATIPTGFTLHESMDHVNIELKREGDGPVQPKHTQLWSGARLVSSDEKVVAHFMRFGVYVSFLAYRNFEEALPLVQRLWEAYIKAFTPQLVNRVSIRYINLLKLPFENGQVDLEKYFQVYIKFPEELTNTLEHFHQQFVILDPNSGVHARVMISNQREEDGNLVVAFDLEGYQERQWTPEDGVIWDDFLLVRNWTYHIFRATLTDACLSNNNS
ncbi:MAG: TIGR04255 family protein [Flavobacteriales bacterium]|nr:TIGR04255 family protein [Flavobacteriales bacterium]